MPNTSRQDSAWPGLRSMRSDPPGRAASGKRRREFTAALDQAEELWRASNDVRPNARPIILFYSLAQASSALVASHGRQGGGWDGRHGHGLLLDPGDGSAKPDLATTGVVPNGDGYLIHRVAEVLGSPVLEERATLLEILCSLPEHASMIESVADDEPLRPIEVHETLYTTTPNPTDIVTASLNPLPERLVRMVSFEHMSEVHTHPGAPTTLELRDWLRPYPSLARFGMPETPDGPFGSLLGGESGRAVSVKWTTGVLRERDEVSAFLASVLDEPLPSGNVHGSWGLAFPAIGGNDQGLHPIIGWWLFLYASSMFARYHPRKWAELLDVDRNPSAVSIENALDVASETWPRLLLRELRRPAVP